MSKKKLFQIVFFTTLFTSLFSAEEQAKKQIAICTHNVMTTAFWSSAYQGMQDAAADMNVEPVVYGAFDPVTQHMPEYIFKAIKEGVAGLVISIPSPTLLKDPIQAALDQGLNVVALRAGFTTFKQLGIKTFVGVDPYQSGTLTATRLIDAGITKLLCVRTATENVALDVRIKGIVDTFNAKNLSTKILTVRDTSPLTASAIISTALVIDPTFDGILSLNSTVALPTTYALEELELIRKIKFATFDYSEKIKQEMLNKKIFLAISEQPYMEGYIAMAIAASGPNVDRNKIFERLQQRTGHNFIPKGSIPYQSYMNPTDVIYTGPIFITLENLDASAIFE